MFDKKDRSAVYCDLRQGKVGVNNCFDCERVDQNSSKLETSRYWLWQA